ncbi:Hypothetical_protein [Hexamita inflata]|uniref:Hypothetical_protein n=1 Tax=Hexamita inflata TaxID=28002 RepID=A0AA86PBN9_9EUKA|nr:Hypothetical protein HINF_LOCUS23480 [Hexamita inflata]
MSDMLDIYDLKQKSFHFPGLNIYLTYTKKSLVFFDKDLQILYKQLLYSDSFYDYNYQCAQAAGQFKLLILNSEIYVPCCNRLYKLNMNSLEFVSCVHSKTRFVTFFTFNGSIFAHNAINIFKLINGQFQWFMHLNGQVYNFCNEIFCYNKKMKTLHKFKDDFSLEFVFKVNVDSYIYQINGMLFIIEQDQETNSEPQYVIQMQNCKVHRVQQAIDFNKLEFNGLVTVERKMCKDILKIDIQDIANFYEEYVEANVTLANLVQELNTKQISEQDVIDCYSRNSKSHTTIASGTGKFVFHDSTITAQINLKSQLYVVVTQNKLAVIDRYQNILDQSVDLRLESNHAKIWQNLTICCGVTYVCVNQNIYSLVSSKLELVAVVPDCTALFSMNDRLYAHSHNYVQLIKNGKPKRVQKVIGQIFQFCDTVFVFNYYNSIIYELDSKLKQQQFVFNTDIHQYRLSDLILRNIRTHFSTTLDTLRQTQTIVILHINKWRWSTFWGKA